MQFFFFKFIISYFTALMAYQFDDCTTMQKLRAVYVFPSSSHFILYSGKPSSFSFRQKLQSCYLKKNMITCIVSSNQAKGIVTFVCHLFNAGRKKNNNKIIGRFCARSEQWGLHRCRQGVWIRHTLYSAVVGTVRLMSEQAGNVIIIISIQPEGRFFGRNQSPVRRPVWLWHTAF